MPDYSKRVLFFWQSNIAAQDKLVVINQTGFNTGNTFYIFNETLSSFQDLAVTEADGTSRLSAWNQTVYIGLNCTFWVSFPVANASYWLYWGNPSASNSWSQTDTFVDVIDSVIGSWLMNETLASDNVVDYSGYGNDGITTGTSVVDSPFEGRNARAFDGVSDVVTVADGAVDFGVENFTLEFWFQRHEAWKNYIGIAALSSYSIGLYGSVSPRLILEFGNGTSYQSAIADNLALSDSINTWEHIAVTVDRGGSYAFYLNGSLTDSWPVTLASDVQCNGTTFLMGAFWADYGNISLCNFNVYRGNALSPTEVSNIASNYADSTIESGKVVVRVWASSKITEVGSVESYNIAPEYSNTEILGVSIALIITFFSVVMVLTLVRRKRNE